MTAPRPYVDQESYKLLANKATLNQGTVDIFFMTFWNMYFYHNFQSCSEFRKYILQILLDVNAFIFLIHENYCQFLKRPKYLLEIIVIPGYN